MISINSSIHRENKQKRLYFKIGNHVVSALKSDCENQIIDCSTVEVLVWTEEEPYYKFEHNDLAQHVAETEDIYRFKGFETPDSLIDQEILQVLKQKYSKKENEFMKVNFSDFVWSEKFRYIKCPVCGEVAVIEVDKILTSMPPQYRWHCEHCNKSGFLLCNETDKFEYVTPTQEDKDLYDPQPKFKIKGGRHIIIDNSEEAQSGTINLVADGSLRINGTCEICGKSFDAGPAVSTGFSEPTRHICHECAEKLKKLIELVK